mgnify:CR=1 FL=1
MLYSKKGAFCMIHLLQNVDCRLQVDEQGRVTLPPLALELLGVGPGGYLRVLLDNRGSRVLLEQAADPVYSPGRTE